MLTKITLEKLTLVVLFLCLTIPYTVKAQDEDATKSIKAEVFIKNRPATSSPKKSTVRYKPKPATSAEAVVPPGGTNFAQVGVTFWRFRGSTAGDKTKELVEVLGSTEKKEGTLERIEEGTPLLPGQQVRLSIESLSRDGYLYVIDREQYADGTLGDPVLVYPTRKSVDSNYIKAGRLIYIPSAPYVFEITPTKGSNVHVGEVLTILVSPKPLIDPASLSPKAIRLPREQVELWEKQWSTTESRFELDGGAGQTITEKEQLAGAAGSQALTQDDPAPQTVYRVAIKPDYPIVVRALLRFTK